MKAPFVYFRTGAFLLKEWWTENLVAKGMKGMGNETVIFHITPGDYWEKAKARHFFWPDNFKENGYIPCANADQLLDSAQYLYKARLHQKVLYINPDKVKAQIVYEDLHKTGQNFPHIYGTLNTDAVLKVVDFKPNENGEFELPKIS
jgi:uncharacterized protein (DUF952 family)